MNATPTGEDELARKLLSLLHRYKYGKTAMQAGKTMRRSEGVAEVEEAMQLIRTNYRSVAEIEAAIAQPITDWYDELRSPEDCKLIAWGYNEAISRQRTALNLPAKADGGGGE